MAKSVKQRLFHEITSTKDELEKDHKLITYPSDLIETVEKFLDFNKGNSIEQEIDEEMKSLNELYKSHNFSEVARRAKKVSDLSKNRADMRIDGIEVRADNEVTAEDVVKAFEKFWVGKCYCKFNPNGEVYAWKKVVAVKPDTKQYYRLGIRLVGPALIVDSGCDGLPNLDLRPYYEEYANVHKTPGFASFEISNEEFEDKFKKAIAICEKIYIDQKEA